MPFDQNVCKSGVMVNGYLVNDPKDKVFLQKKLAQLNEIELECQADEHLSESDVCYSVVNDFLSRPKLYETCIVALIESQGPITERRVEAVACFSVKPMYLNGRYINTAFGFLTRTRPSYRRKGAIKTFYSMLPKTFATFNVETCIGYIHKGNTASLSMNNHTPIFGEHQIRMVRSRDNAQECKTEVTKLSSARADEIYQSVHKDNDFAWKTYMDILEHRNHLGTFSVSNSEVGEVGVSLWDMSKLAKLSVNHGKKAHDEFFRYHLAHNLFYIKADGFDNTTADGADKQFQLMETLVLALQKYAQETFNITHLIFDIDETLCEWTDLLDTSFQVVGKTAEYLSGFGINTEKSAKKSDIKRWLDPRDFSTLLFFNQGNTDVSLRTTSVATTVAPEDDLTLIGHAGKQINNDNTNTANRTIQLSAKL